MATLSDRELRQMLNETFKKNNIGWRNEDVLDIAQGETEQKKWFLWDYGTQQSYKSQDEAIKAIIARNGKIKHRNGKWLPAKSVAVSAVGYLDKYLVQE